MGKRVYEERFLREHKDKSPQQIAEDMCTRALATVDEIRAEGEREHNRLAAAKAVLEYTMTKKTSSTVEHSGEVTFNVTKRVVTSGDGD